MSTPPPQRVLLTGGTGYIGSHTAVALMQAGHTVVFYDNLCNSQPDVVDRITEITGSTPEFVQGDIRDTALLRGILAEHEIHAVMHFAGLKAVGESNENPLSYYDNNVSGTVSLLKAMTEAGVKRLVFSSSATVYGEPRYLPIDEQHPTAPTNPYGRTKLHIEQMLRDVTESGEDWHVVCLRYFNPAGAHPSGLIGERPSGTPNNLMPYICQVADGKLSFLRVFGDDYDTVDGTGVRDYIHVCDLAEGHLAALDSIGNLGGVWTAINLGTGKGTSVMQMVAAFEKAAGVRIPYEIQERRPGDVDSCYASSDLAKRELNWQASSDIHSMCESMWRYQTSRIMAL